MPFLEDVLTAHQYAQNCLRGIDGPEVKDSPDRLAEAVYAVLWALVQTESEPESERYAAAVAQYIYSGHSEAEIVEAIKTDQTFRDLLVKSMGMKDWFEGPHHDVVFHDCLLQLAHELGIPLPL